MRRITVFAPLLLLAAVLLSASAAFAKSGTLTFSNQFVADSTCTATFNRSATDVVNEKDLTCSPGLPGGLQYPGVLANVYLQYRPDGKNGKCDASGLVASQAKWSTNDPKLTKDYFVSGLSGGLYTVCVYLVNPVIAFGNLVVDDINGSTTVIPVSGKYSVCIIGVYSVDRYRSDAPLADAKYLSFDGINWTDAPALSWYNLNFHYAEVQVNRQFVDWGKYKSNHTYCQVIGSAEANTFNLRVYDADENDPPEQDWWWGDNGNSTMQYMITYLGQ